MISLNNDIMTGLWETFIITKYINSVFGLENLTYSVSFVTPQHNIMEDRGEKVSEN